jgi:hypothetical protein
MNGIPFVMMETVRTDGARQAGGLRESAIDASAQPDRLEPHPTGGFRGGLQSG